MYNMRTRRVRERNHNLQNYVVHNAYYIFIHQKYYRPKDSMGDPLVFSAKDGIDTLHYVQAMRTTNKRNFIDTMVKEVKELVDRNR